MANKVESIDSGSSYQSEDQLQAKCFQWYWNNYPNLRRTLFAVPNGGARNKFEAARMKGTGTVAGVSDLIWVLMNYVDFIEMKTTEGKQSEEQKAFEKMVVSMGHRYKVIRTLSEFKIYVWNRLADIYGMQPWIKFGRN